MARAELRMAAAVAMLLACAPEARAAPPPAGSVYVSMGSSFAAGPRIGTPEPGPAPGCGRSSVNYANLLAARLKLKLIDVGCGGATTKNVLTTGQFGQKPQIGALTPDARLVTVLIGGNDLGYLGSLNASSCIFLAARPGGPPCRAAEPVMPTAEQIASVSEQIGVIAQEVHSRAPGARLIFIDYQTILPAQGSCADTPMSAESLTRERLLGQWVSEAIRQGAKSAGAELLSANALTQGHDACAADPWVHGYPLDPTQTAYTPYHPNAKAMQAIANALADTVLLRPAP